MCFPDFRLIVFIFRGSPTLPSFLRDPAFTDVLWFAGQGRVRERDHGKRENGGLPPAHPGEATVPPEEGGRDSRHDHHSYQVNGWGTCVSQVA